MDDSNVADTRPVALAPTASATRVSRNVLSLLFARLAVALAALLSLPVVYGHLGPVEFGIWALLSGLAALVSMADFGLGSAIVREIASNLQEFQSGRVRMALGLGVAWGVVLPLAAIVVIAALWPFLATLLNFGSTSGAALWATVILLLGVMMDGLALPWRGILEGTQRYATLGWVSGGTAILAAVLAVVVVGLGQGIIWLAGTVLLASAIRAVLNITLCRRACRSASPSLFGMRRDVVKSIGAYGLRVQVTTVSGAVNLELDRFVLSAFFGPAVAGGFDLGGRLANLLRLPATFALMALFPMAVTKAVDGGREWLTHFNIVATKYLTAFAAISAACMLVCADPLVRLWLGEPNWWAAVNIAILAPAYAVNLASGAITIITRVEGKPGRETVYALLSLALNLALTWPLLYWLGPPGVPLATAIGVTASTIYFIVTYHRVTDRPLRPLLTVIWPSALASTVGVGAGLLAMQQLPSDGSRLDAGMAVLGGSAVILLTAGLVLFATGFMSANDRMQIKRHLYRRPRGSVHSWMAR